MSTDKFKRLDTWRYHQMFLSLEQTARIADEAMELLKREIGWRAVPLYISFGADGKAPELSFSPIETPDTLKVVKDAQQNFRFALRIFLADIGMGIDAAALARVDAMKADRENEDGDA